MISAGHEFLTAVEILKNWLEEYESDLKTNNPQTQTIAHRQFLLFETTATHEKRFA